MDPNLYDNPNEHSYNSLYIMAEDNLDQNDDDDDDGDDDGDNHRRSNRSRTQIAVQFQEPSDDEEEDDDEGEDDDEEEEDDGGEGGSIVISPSTTMAVTPHTNTLVTIASKARVASSQRSSLRRAIISSHGEIARSEDNDRAVANETVATRCSKRERRKPRKFGNNNDDDATAATPTNRKANRPKKKAPQNKTKAPKRKGPAIPKSNQSSTTRRDLLFGSPINPRSAIQATPGHSNNSHSKKDDHDNDDAGTTTTTTASATSTALASGNMRTNLRRRDDDDPDDDNDATTTVIGYNPRRSKRLRSQENDDDKNTTMLDDNNDDDDDDDVNDGDSDVPTPAVMEFVKRRMFAKRRIRADNTDDDDDDDDDSVAIDADADVDADADSDADADADADSDADADADADSDADADADSYDNNDDDDNDDDDDDVIVAEEFYPGLRVGIFWPLDDAYYLCTVVKKQNSEWLVRYDDEVVEWIDPVNEQLCSVRYKKRLDKFVTRKMTMTTVIRQRPIFGNLDQEEQQQYDGNNDNNNDNHNFDIGQSRVYKAFINLGTGISVMYHDQIYDNDYPGDKKRIITEIKERHSSRFRDATYIDPVEEITEQLDTLQEKYDNEHKEGLEIWLLTKPRYSWNNITNNIEYDHTKTATWETWDALDNGEGYHHLIGSKRKLVKGDPVDEQKLIKHISRLKYNSNKFEYNKKNTPRNARSEVDTTLWPKEERALYQKVTKKNYNPPTTDEYFGYTAMGKLYQNGMIGQLFNQLDETIVFVPEESENTIDLIMEKPFYKKDSDNGKNREGDVCKKKVGYYCLGIRIGKKHRFPNGDTLTVSCVYAKDIFLHCARLFRDVYQQHKKGKQLSHAERCWLDRIMQCKDLPTRFRKFEWECSHLDHDPLNVALANLIVELGRANDMRRIHCFKYARCQECTNTSIHCGCECDPPCKRLAKIICHDCITVDNSFPSTLFEIEDNN